MPAFIDLTGKRFGRWLVVERAPAKSYGNVRWRCLCDCGRDGFASGSNLRGGLSVQCSSCSHSGPRNTVPADPLDRIRRKKHPYGYVEVRVWPGHPWYQYAYRQTAGYQRAGLEHRLVMAEHHGRSLESYESVHHIDGDRSNNTLENLQLRSSAHGYGQVRQCRDCGSQNIETIEL